METIGLKGIWGLEQLDRAGIPNWRLGLMLIGGCTLIGALLITILPEMNSDSVLYVAPRVLSIWLMLDSFLMGFFLFGTMAMARATEADLRLLSPMDDSVNEGIRLLRPTATVLLPSILFGLILFQAAPIIMDIVSRNISVAERFAALPSSGIESHQVV
jgi:hypothetical protein